MGDCHKFVERKPKLAEDLYALLEEQDPYQKFYDFVIMVKKDGIVDDEFDAIYAHTAILAARSTVFRGLFTVDTLPRPYFVLLLHEEPGFENVKREEVFEFLKFMYTDTVEVNMDNVINIIKLAIRFEVETLKAICENAILAQLSSENCAFFLDMANTLNLVAVKSAILIYIRANMKKLIFSPDFKALSRVTRESQQLFEDFFIFMFCE